MSERTMAQRKPGPSPTFTPIVHEVLRSAGQPLDPVTRALMESRFGHSFNQVQVYTDAKAGDSARAVNALAYTIGRDVVFGAGQYAPRTREGQKLLAHELTHVVQQERGGHTRPTLDGSGPLEQAASDVAAAFMRSSGPVAVPGASALGIACSPDTQEPWWKRARHSLGELADKVDEKYAAARQTVGQWVDTTEVGQILSRADARRQLLQSIVDTDLPALTQTIEQAVNKFEDSKSEVPQELLDTKSRWVLERVEQNAEVNRQEKQIVGAVVKALWGLTGIANIAAHPVNTLRSLGELPGPAGPLNPAKELGLEVSAIDDLITSDKTAKQILYEYLDKHIPYPERVQAQAMNLLKGLGEKYIEAAGYRVNPTTQEIEKGGQARWSEIPGRLLVDVGTFFITGGAAGEAVQASKVVGTAGQVDRAIHLFGLKNIAEHPVILNRFEAAANEVLDKWKLGGLDPNWKVGGKWNLSEVTLGPKLNRKLYKEVRSIFGDTMKTDPILRTILEEAGAEFKVSPTHRTPILKKELLEQIFGREIPTKKWTEMDRWFTLDHKIPIKARVLPLDPLKKVGLPLDPQNLRIELFVTNRIREIARKKGLNLDSIVIKNK